MMLFTVMSQALDPDTISLWWQMTTSLLSPRSLFLEICSPQHVISVTRKENIDYPYDGYEDN